MSESVVVHKAIGLVQVGSTSLHAETIKKLSGNSLQRTKSAVAVGRNSADK